MQTPPRTRRTRDRGAHWRAMSLALISLWTAAAPAQGQDLAQLESMAKAEAAREFPALTNRQRFVVGPIASTQLEKCNRQVTPVVASPQHMRDRVMIELRCQ